MSYTNREKIKAILIKTFELYNAENQLKRIQIMIDFLDESGKSVEEIAKALKTHFQESSFPPTIADIMTRCAKPKEDDFMSRFRRQAYSGYDEHVVDDDVYTIRQLIGRERMRSAILRDIPWIEKEALERFRDLKAGFVLVKQNPALDRVVKIGTAGSYAMLSQSKNQNSLAQIVSQSAAAIKPATQIASSVFVELRKIEPSITFAFCCDEIEKSTNESFNDLFNLALKEKGPTLKTVVGLFTSFILDVVRGGDHFYNFDSGQYEQIGVVA